MTSIVSPLFLKSTSILKLFGELTISAFLPKIPVPNSNKPEFPRTVLHDTGNNHQPSPNRNLQKKEFKNSFLISKNVKVMLVALGILFACFCIIPISAQAHEVFKLLQGSGEIKPPPSQPTINDVPTYEDEDNWIFSGKNQTYFLIPKRLVLVRSQTPFLFGASIQSKKQNHLIVLLVHSADKSAIKKSIKKFVSSNPQAKVDLYPALVPNISFITDPLDHLVLKFNSTASSSNLDSPNFMTLSVIQSSGRSNVQQIKSLMSNGINAVAYLSIKITGANGVDIAKILTIPLELNSINLTSNGL